MATNVRLGPTKVDIQRQATDRQMVGQLTPSERDENAGGPIGSKLGTGF